MKVNRIATILASATVVLALTGCGSDEPVVMPDVVGKQLDVAKSDIERAGFGGDVEVIGGGVFGVLDDSNWLVCEQEPAPGSNVSEPRVIVDRECGTNDASGEVTSPTEESSPAPSEPADVTDITVDELLDRLNSADMGGIQVGDRFRFSGELTASDMWFTGASGEYSVLFIAHGGADDLMVLLNEADAAGWTDGTRLQMVVENVEVTINGETTDGWLRMVSAAPAA